jgi:hypothetical protein
VAWQVGGHEIAWVLLATPETPPEPCTVTVSVCCGALKFAVTDLAVVMLKEQVVLDPANAHAPPQPANVAPPCVAAVKVTVEPIAKDAAQSGEEKPQ